MCVAWCCSLACLVGAASGVLCALRGRGGVVYMQRSTRDDGDATARGETALQQLGHKETQRPFFSCRASGAVRTTWLLPVSLLFYYSCCLGSQLAHQKKKKTKLRSEWSKDGVKNLVESREEELACIATWEHKRMKKVFCLNTLWVGRGQCMYICMDITFLGQGKYVHHLSDVPKRPNLTCCPLDACLIA